MSQPLSRPSRSRFFVKIKDVLKMKCRDRTGKILPFNFSIYLQDTIKYTATKVHSPKPDQRCLVYLTFKECHDAIFTSQGPFLFACPLHTNGRCNGFHVYHWLTAAHSKVQKSALRMLFEEGNTFNGFTGSQGYMQCVKQWFFFFNYFFSK